jgi:hypothetical protein
LPKSFGPRKQLVRDKSYSGVHVAGMAGGRFFDEKLSAQGLFSFFPQAIFHDAHFYDRALGCIAFAAPITR